MAETSKLVDQTDDVVVVALDIDQNEDARAVIDHIDRNAFTGYFAVAPASLTKVLVDVYGTAVITPPQSPKILLNPDQTDSEFMTGVRSAAELRELADEFK